MRLSLRPSSLNTLPPAESASTVEGRGLIMRGRSRRVLRNCPLIVSELKSVEAQNGRRTKCVDRPNERLAEEFGTIPIFAIAKLKEVMQW